MRRSSIDEPLNLRIVLVGKTGSGKSSAGNTILGQKVFENDALLESLTKTCERGEVEISGRTISVIDTPGLFDTRKSEEELKDEIVKCVEMSVPGPHVFLLVIRLDVKFTDEEKNTVKMIPKYFGEEAASYTIVLFTHADALDGKPLNEYFSDSEDIWNVLSQCRGRFHLFNCKDMENRNQVSELLEKIEKMLKRNGGRHYTNEMYREAQKKIEWEGLKKKVKSYGKTAATAIGMGVVAVAAVAAVAIAVEAAGEGGVAKAIEGAAAGGAAAAATQIVEVAAAKVNIGI